MAQLALTGRVVDRNEAPVPGAHVTVQAQAAAGSWAATSDPRGGFSVILPGPGDYRIGVQAQGYFELRGYQIRLEGPREAVLVLDPLREVFQTIDVNETPSRVALDQTAREERLTGTEINDVPYPASHSLRNSMRLIPGVVQDSTGAMHFEGGTENQVYYTLNGFNIADPITGRFQTQLGVEGVRSVEYSGGRYSPEYGKGSAGVLAIRTDPGTDQFRYTGTNFVPAVDTQQGLHLGNWRPRVGVSGPIRRGRAWFADNLSGSYDQAVVTDLPKGQNTRSGWSLSNLLHTQVNLTPSQILFADFLVNRDDQGRVGLGALDPVSTTSTVRSSQYFFSVRDQLYFGHGLVLEAGYAHNRFFDRQVPQGTDLYVLAPAGRSGNYFVNSRRWSTRDQGIANVFLPGFHLAGAHQIKAGVDLDHVRYAADFSRTGYEQVGLAGYVLSKTVFQGSGALALPDVEASSYVVDTWRLRRNLQLELGLRQDWDQLVGQVALSPRLSVAWSPFGSTRTRITGGYAITHDPANLGLLSRPLDQVALTTRYNADGTPAGAPQLTTFAADRGHLRFPRYRNWTAGIDLQFAHRIDAGANWIRRRGQDGFTYASPDSNPSSLQFGSPAAGQYTLTNLRHDAYDAAQFTIRQTFSGQYEWMASYTRSRALSNAVMDISIDQPFQIENNLGPLPWDAPHRFLGWAYLPVPRTRDWALAVLADGRSGFPFSIVDQTGRVLGGVNSLRYSSNFDLNIHIERRFTLWGRRFAIRAGYNNVTNHRNPTAVNNTYGSPNYLQFYGYEGRHAVVRLRMFGKS